MVFLMAQRPSDFEEFLQDENAFLSVRMVSLMPNHAQGVINKMSTH